jgi:lipoate-protein ligase A
MLYCDISSSPAENLACDEALLELCEGGAQAEVLRVWEPIQHFVVLGYANQAKSEVHLDYCKAHGIPVLRRCTGGGTVLQGSGVLNYSLVLRADAPLQSITAANEYIMRKQQTALRSVRNAPIEVCGHTDLAVAGLKFSGNAQRRGKRALLFHGSLLLNLDLALVGKTLRLPSRQPEYRLNRSHSEFLMNLRVPAETVMAALRKAWEAEEPLLKLPSERIATLVNEKYGRDEWNYKF